MGIDIVAASMHSRFEAKASRRHDALGLELSTWWNGGLRTTAYFHNQIGLLTETIGNPTPIDDPVRARAAAAARRPAVSRSRRSAGTSASRSTIRSRRTRGARHRARAA
jgi:hypothetical protein